MFSLINLPARSFDVVLFPRVAFPIPLEAGVERFPRSTLMLHQFRRVHSIENGREEEASVPIGPVLSSWEPYSILISSPVTVPEGIFPDDLSYGFEVC